ncbi:MAG: glycoside hydrolase domain-containing protein, partial [Planctomycetota bacterium]
MTARKIVRSAALMVMAVVLTCSHARAAEEFLWRIGKPDNKTKEFALGPDRFRSYTEDGRFVVGESDPSVDWPYCHPGPRDSWAGGRKHTFSIFFGLSEDSSGDAELVVDLADTHPQRPPTLTFKVNGKSLDRWRHETPAGGGDASIEGDASAGQEHTLTITIPGNILRPGLNRIDITNAERSWMLYDWVGLRGAKDASLSRASAAHLRSVNVSPWLVKKNGTWVQPVDASLIAAGIDEPLTVQVGDGEAQSVALDRGRGKAQVALPPVKEPTSATLKVKSGATILDSEKITRRPAEKRRPVDYIDPMLGTSQSRWMLFPGPSMPFGMVKLSPDNEPQKWKAGYEYTIENITGFSHLHSWTMGGLLTMPTTGELQTSPGPHDNPDKGYRSRFRHETEEASAGYYAVTLDDYDVRAELTSTTRAGFHRYTFPKADHARILFDLLFPTEYGFNVKDARIKKVSDREIAGYAEQQSTDWNEYTVHFVARFSKPFDSMGGWKGEDIRRDIEEISGSGDMGVFLNYQTADGETVKVKTGISFVSIEQARLNLETEMERFGWDFDAVHQHNRSAWKDLIDCIQVKGGTEEQKVKFFTNFYRAYSGRTIMSDVNGKYVDMYEKVQQLSNPDSPVYGCDAFWNTFWNLNQL